MITRRTHPMRYFDDHDDQDLQDLQYGEQLASCERLKKEGQRPYEDGSITRSWTADED